MNERTELLSINNLTIHYKTEDGTVRAVNNVSLSLKKGRTLGLVGETGAGKTTIALGIIGLVPDPPGKIVSGSIELYGENLIGKKKSYMREVRGKRISMIFQDPMTALNPIDPVGDQIAEVIRLHEKVSKAEAVIKAGEVLELVGIPRERAHEYPHQFSGGMRQRIIIAIALACNPELLIADEPTTALDVTLQAQVMGMMNKLKTELGTSMIMITHDLGIVAEMCDEVAVIYAGEIVEFGDLEDVFDRTSHPYTVGLFNSLPSVAAANNRNRLSPIQGLMPDPTDLPDGCKFSPRCPHQEEKCLLEEQSMIGVSGKHFVRCWKWDNAKGER
jgi:peptide/nickel transport system ATP-binding protein